MSAKGGAAQPKRSTTTAIIPDPNIKRGRLKVLRRTDGKVIVFDTEAPFAQNQVGPELGSLAEAAATAENLVLAEHLANGSPTRPICEVCKAPVTKITLKREKRKEDDELMGPAPEGKKEKKGERLLPVRVLFECHGASQEHKLSPAELEAGRLTVKPFKVTP